MTVHALPVPITGIKRSIRDYVSNSKNAVAVLMKGGVERFYKKVIVVCPEES
jgi:hypothetical protein